MARARDDHQQLLRLAAQLLPGQDELHVLVVRGLVEVIRPAPPPRPSPAGLSDYDRAIFEALEERPVPARRLARLAGRRHNTHFGERLRTLVDRGLARHTRAGYSLA